MRWLLIGIHKIVCVDPSQPYEFLKYGKVDPDTPNYIQKLYR